jgi:hypothetical protein
MHTLMHTPQPANSCQIGRFTVWVLGLKDITARLAYLMHVPVILCFILLSSYRNTFAACRVLYSHKEQHQFSGVGAGAVAPNHIRVLV